MKTRKKENRPFYQSLNFIRYYYTSGPDLYRVVRIDGLEADDLVSRKKYKELRLLLADIELKIYKLREKTNKLLVIQFC